MRFREFLRRFQLEYLTNALKETAARFPLSVACAAAGAIVSMLEVHEFKLLADDHLQRLLLFLSYALVFFTSARLFAEGSRLSKAREWLLMAAGGIGLAALVAIPDQFSAMHMMVSSALTLSMLFAPYIGRNSSEDSVWYYNYLNGISLAIAGLSTVILCLGVSAIIGSMDYLLYDMQLSVKVYADIWIFGGCFFGPVMFLHQLSRQFDFEKGECVMLPGIFFIANYLVVPLILIYMWVLYVYFLKIAVQWELPKGNLAYMVTSFGALGVAARMAVFPMRQEKGTQLLRQFYKYFYYMLIIPLVLLAIGLYTRISQYGITEERYAIGICLVWLSALCVWNIARPAQAHIKHVPMALAILFLFGAFGPWGAVSLSTRDQVGRLDALLHRVGVIKQDGSIVRTAQEVPFKVRQDISGILDYMFNGKRSAIMPWLEPFRAELAKKSGDGQSGLFTKEGDACERRFTRCWQDMEMPQYVMEVWGMQYVSRWQTEDTEGKYVTITANRGNWTSLEIVKVQPYAYAVWFTPYNEGSWNIEKVWKEGGKEKFRLKFVQTGPGVFTATLSDGRQAVFDLMPVAEHFMKEHVTAVPEAEMDRLDVEPAPGAGFPARITITELHGTGAAGHFKLDGASMLFLFSTQ